MIDELGDVVHERVFHHPIDRVWDAISRRDALAQWLMPNDFAPVAGRRFRLDAGAPRGVIDAEVVEIEPPQLMCWRWTIDGVATTVTITLHAVAGGTALRLVHSGLPGEPRPRFERGWVEKLDALEPVLQEPG